MRLLGFAVTIIIIASAGVLSVLPKEAYPEEVRIVETDSGFRIQETESQRAPKRDIVQDIEEKRKNIRRDIKSDHQNFKESIDPSDDKARLHRLHKKKKELHHKMLERKYDSHKFNQDRDKKRKNIRGDLRDATLEKQRRYHTGPEPVRREHRGIKK